MPAAAAMSVIGRSLASWAISSADFIVCLLSSGRSEDPPLRITRSNGLDNPLFRPARPAVALEVVIEPRRGAGEPAIRRRDERLEALDVVRRLGAFHHLDPDARLLGDDLAGAMVGAAAGAVAHLLGAGLRAHVLHAA